VDRGGPGVPDSRHGAVFDAGGGVALHLHRGLYHEVSLPDPDLILGLNAGLAAYGTFRPTVERLVAAARKGTPVVFSDLNEESATMAAESLQKAGGALSLGISINPFRCPRTEQGPSRGFAIPSLSNGFLFAMAT